MVDLFSRVGVFLRRDTYSLVVEGVLLSAAVTSLFGSVVDCDADRLDMHASKAMNDAARSARRRHKHYHHHMICEIKHAMSNEQRKR